MLVHLLVLYLRFISLAHDVSGKGLLYFLETLCTVSFIVGFSFSCRRTSEHKMAYPFLLPVLQIMRVKMLPSGQAKEIEEVYSNDGSEISASSSVVVYNNKMLIGTVLTDAWHCIP